MSGESRASWAIAAALTLGTTSSGLAQGLVAPANGEDLERISRRMAEAVRDLGDDIAAGPGQTPQGQYLERDARELQRATGDWYANIRGNADPYQIRRSYAGLDVSWHRLRGQLDQPGLMTPALADEARRVEQADAQIHQALGLNAYPTNFDGPSAPPTGLDETRRLAYTLAQRGEALAAVVRAEYGPNSNAAFLANDCDQLARMVDGYYDSLNNAAIANQPDFARTGFIPIVQQSVGMGVNLDRVGKTLRVTAAWNAYTPIFNLLRGNLGLEDNQNGFPAQQPVIVNVPAVPVQTGIPYNPNPTAAIAGWADQLDGQVDDLLNHFAPTAQVVPEGGEMLEDMQRLRRAVVEFRRHAAQVRDAGRLAYEFREVDANWQRLARRIERIAANRGRAAGPNIERVRQIGQTCEQIHQALGMPGYPPTFGPN